MCHHPLFHCWISKFIDNYLADIFFFESVYFFINFYIVSQATRLATWRVSTPWIISWFPLEHPLISQQKQSLEE
mgnify:CR=1 FL=1